METKELHLIAMVGNQDPTIGSNDERIQNAARDIISLLEPAGLWVLCGPGKDTEETADRLNNRLGSLSLNPGNVAINGFLSEGAVGEEGADDWRSDLSLRSDLAFLKSNHLSQKHETGLVLITSEDIVSGIPEIVNMESYEQKLDTRYAGVNRLRVGLDESGSIPARKPTEA